VCSITLGWVLGGNFHAKRVAKKLYAKHKADQKQLYQQYYKHALQQGNVELLAGLEEYEAAAEADAAS
jgi:hypothetical protein